jgi:hypothetical protein
MRAQAPSIRFIVYAVYCMYERVRSEVHYLSTGTIFFFLQKRSLHLMNGGDGYASWT